MHAVTDERIARHPDLDRIAGVLADAGGDHVALHARGRTLSGREHFELAQRLPGVRFVNDRLDIALAVHASGVQLGQDSLGVSDARSLGPQWWIGRSVHGLAEAQAALGESADYLVVGPVFATATHADRKPMGLAGFAEIARLGLPAVAIGGVTAARAPQLRDAGAYGVAAIRELWDAQDPASAVRALLEVFV